MKTSFLMFALVSLAPSPLMSAQANILPEWSKEYTEKISSKYDCKRQGYTDIQELRKCQEAFSLKECFTYTDGRFYKKFYPVDEEMLVTTSLKYLGKSTMNFEYFNGKVYSDLPPYQECKRSKVRLTCISGSCRASFSGGEYGFHPSYWNEVSIDGRKWSWKGDDDYSIGHQMWKQIKNGSRVAYQLARWPDSYPSGVEKVIIPKGMKERMYQLSLTKEN